MRMVTLVMSELVQVVSSVPKIAPSFGQSLYAFPSSELTYISHKYCNFFVMRIDRKRTIICAAMFFKVL